MARRIDEAWRNWLVLGLAATTLAACGQGVHTVDDLGEPLVVLNARIEGQQSIPMSRDTLRASLIWETLPEEMLRCMEAAETDAEVYRCTLMVGFTSTLATRSVPVEPVFPASFEMPIHALPGPDILSGEPGARFTYGILVVYEDGNKNGGLDLVAPQARSSSDTILASSMPAPGQHADYIVYREGALSPLYKMFATFDCPEPEQGFSIVRLEAGRPLPTCSLLAIDETDILVMFQDSDDVRQLVCEPTPVRSTFPAQAPPAGRRIDCSFDSALTFVEDPSAYCHHTVRYELAGCHRPESCAQLDWDLTAAPPDWWPCDGSESTGFAISDSPDTISEVSDELFYIYYLAGKETFAVEDLQVWVYQNASTGWIFTHPLFIRHQDNDFDGLVTPGDSLLVVEALGVDKFNQQTTLAAHPVQLMRTTPTLPDRPLANLIWRP